jgi:S-adenosylmethionine hydrolase
LSAVLGDASAWRTVQILQRIGPPPAPSGLSRTFHGRDVFAPAAAHLALGRPLGELGPSVTDPIRMREPAPLPTDQGGEGIVVAVDHFGNLLTNVPGEWLQASAVVTIGGRALRTVPTYADARPGELVALVSSDGRVEVAAREASAAELLGLGVGAPVVLRW